MGGGVCSGSAMVSPAVLPSARITAGGHEPCGCGRCAMIYCFIYGNGRSSHASRAMMSLLAGFAIRAAPSHYRNNTLSPVTGLPLDSIFLGYEFFSLCRLEQQHPGIQHCKVLSYPVHPQRLNTSQTVIHTVNVAHMLYYTCSSML